MSSANIMMRVRNRLILSFPNRNCYFFNDEDGCRFPSKTCICAMCPYSLEKTSSLDDDIGKISVVYSRVQARKTHILSWIGIVLSMILVWINLKK